MNSDVKNEQGSKAIFVLRKKEREKERERKNKNRVICIRIGPMRSHPHFSRQRTSAIARPGSSRNAILLRDDLRNCNGCEGDWVSKVVGGSLAHSRVNSCRPCSCCF